MNTHQVENLIDYDLTSQITAEKTAGKIDAEIDILCFFNLSLDLMCTIDQHGNFHQLNCAWETTLGYTDQELLSQHYTSLVYADDLTFTIAKLNEAKAAFITNSLSVDQQCPIPITLENRYRCKNGDYKWLSWRLKIDQKTQLIYAIARDITQSKQAELTKQLSEQRLQKQQASLMLLALSQPFYKGNLKEVWQVVTETAAETLEVDRSSIWLYRDFQLALLPNQNYQSEYKNLLNNQDQELICVDLYEINQQKHSQGIAINKSDFPVYFQSLSNDRIIAAPEAQKDPRLADLLTVYLKPFGVISLLDIPIRIEGQIIGVLSLESLSSQRFWTLDEQNFADFLAYMTALAIESHQRILAESDLEQSLSLLQATLQSSRVTETELEKSLSLLQATLESTADGILVIDSTGKIMNYNHKFVEMWKIPAELIQPKNYEKIVDFLNSQLAHPDRLLSCVQDDQNYHTTEGYDILDLADGRVFERYSQLQPILTNSSASLTTSNYLAGNHNKTHNFNYTVSCWVWSFRDITERTKVERLKNEFVSMVSHELRTPLTSIKGSLSLIAGGVVGTIPPQVKSLVDIAFKNSDRLVVLINDILDIEKIESGKMDFHIEPVKLQLLVEQAIEANKSYGEQYNVSFVLTESLPEIKVNVDSDRIIQVITNFLSNAAKFSPAHEIVTISMTRQNQMIRVAVTDRGCGIPESFQSKIFQKFAQADSSDTRQKGGSGLGLSICKVIIEKMGGKIGFITAPNAGTTFYFDLPELMETELEQQAVTEIIFHQKLLPEGSPLSSILICEDDPDISTLLSLLLKSGGFGPIDIAHNAAIAKELLSQKSYAAMTLDLAMPDQDGLSLLRELRAQERYQDLPIVVISAKAQEGRAELAGGGLAVIDWLDKPIDQARLMLAVRQAIRRSDGKACILHIEDDADLKKVVSVILEDIAYLVHASNLEDARQKLSTQIFDLILLDLGLPDGSGMDLLSEINKASHPPIPIVVFSAQELGGELAQQVAANLVKSRTSNQNLLDTIKTLITRNDEINV